MQVVYHSVWTVLHLRLQAALSRRSTHCYMRPLLLQLPVHTRQANEQSVTGSNRYLQIHGAKKCILCERQESIITDTALAVQHVY